MLSFCKWFSAVAAIVLFVGPSSAADAILAGKVKSVNAEKKSFVVTDAAGKDHSLKLDDHVTINRSNKESSAELKAGDAVNVCHDNGTLSWTAHYILVQDGETKNCVLVRCTIKSYDAAKKQIIFTDTADNHDWTFALGTAAVRLNGKDTNPTNLKIGDNAVAIIDRTMGADRGTLSSILAWRK